MLSFSQLSLRSRGNIAFGVTSSLLLGVGLISITSERAMERDYLRQHEVLTEISRLAQANPGAALPPRIRESIGRLEQAPAPRSRRTMVIVVFAFLGSLALGIGFFRRLSNALARVASLLARRAREVNETSSMISESSSTLSVSATEQASSLEASVASIQELNVTVAKNAENAVNSLKVSDESKQTVHEGRKTLEELITTIQGISQSNDAILAQIESSNQEMSGIVQLIQEIGTKASVINDIVFQTKLLSFNASIEAARAGEQGKGFSVVAEEVGNLARMSGTAAREISDLLGNSVERTQNIFKVTTGKVHSLIQEAQAQIHRGTTVAQRCHGVLDQIVSHSDAVNQIVGEISLACQQQAKGILEISKSVNKMDEVTQKNANNAQQTASSSVDLTTHAQLFQDVVGDLLAIVRGFNQSEAPARPLAKVIPIHATNDKTVVPVEPGLEYYDI